MKKFSFSFLVLLFVSITNVVYANNSDVENHEELVKVFLEAQYTGIKEGNDEDVLKLFKESDDTILYTSFLSWRIKQSQIMGTNYSDYSYTITSLNIDEKGILKGSIDFDYFIDGVETPFQEYDINFSIKFDEHNLITYYDTSEAMFTDYTNYLIENRVIKTTRSGSLVVDEEEIEDSDSQLLDNLEQFIIESAKATIDSEINNTVLPPTISRSRTYSYNANTGILYAKEYVKYRNQRFYVAGLDCTNFVSQCIWAAYGGWSSNDSSNVIATNISNKKRMVSGKWQAGTGGGTSSWENVNSLWNYVTTNTGTGPRAIGSNNNAPAYNTSALAIKTGNVLQFRNASHGNNNYQHSVYVIENNVKQADMANRPFAKIVVAQHSYNQTRSLADVVSTTYSYMRRLSFSSASFDR